ncbi:protein disabled [Drosophila grimshawi]|uniref:protein disabled n=1 Tax=Drosophila grimshawi TaxID=7222 RepID=UPI000C86F87E|nr:protein disabled [Drosophila grimshawi]
MVKSLVSKLQATSNLSLAQTFGIGNTGAEETNYAKHRNDPGRFFGDGVQFKAKLIGILEVGEARGDRMCQEALQDLKMAIRAAGEHKQRIIIHVTIDGLRLRDEKTSDSLYHHPVHKISFIAQDMTDSRAFGYIFGSPDSGHRFFGIKTDKAASQVVLAMRDLFQVVFELKKKEIEMARQQIQGKALHDHASQLATLSSLKSAHGDLASGTSGSASSSAAHAAAANLSMLGASSSNGVGLTRLGVNLDVSRVAGVAGKEISPESVADLVDLEQELTSLQRGISQMERITPNDPATSHPGAPLAKSASEDDPFGDSFIYVPSYNILPPPPESGRTRHKQQLSKTPESVAGLDAMSTLISPAPGASGSPATLQPDDDDSWLHELQQQHDVFDTTRVTTTPTPMSAAAVLANLPMAPLATRESSATPTQQISEISAAAAPSAAATSTIDVGLSALSSLAAATEAAEGAPATTTTAVAVMSDAFTDLDPLGIGRTRPYVDKKYFFQELKNPPKKLLKELGTSQGDNFDDFLGGTNRDSIFEDNNSPTITTATTTATTTTNIEVATASGNSSSSSNSSSNPTATNPLIATASLGQQQQLQLQQQLLLTTNTNQSSTRPRSRSQLSPSQQQQQSQQSQHQSQSQIYTNTQPQAQSQSQSQLQHSHIAHIHTQTPTLSQYQAEDFSAAKLKLMLRQSAAMSKSTNTALNYYTTEPATTIHNLEEQQDANPVLLPRDTDPFSPTRKKSDPDPFQEGDLFAKLDAFEFETTSSSSPAVFNGPLQVQLPPEQQTQSQSQSQSQSDVWQADISRLEPVPSSVRHRPTPVASVVNVGGPLDVISSISNKKMPHLFGQARFSKRGDSASGIGSSVNMRRLQESDSLSENEAAPEPPPRPDSTPYAEPPPLPPKKQFSDLIIRPTATAPPVGRYEYLNHSSNQLRRSIDAPPIPLPSRRVGRSDGYFPGPGRPRKPGHTDDDYLAPLGGGTSASTATSTATPTPPPPLLPPPTQTGSSRARPQRQASLGRPQDIYENKAEILQAQAQKEAAAATALAPDITLTQLLTLGMDDLALRLNVPASKLSTMTLVQLTSYLSDYLQSTGDQLVHTCKSRTSPAQQLASPAAPVGTASSSTAAVFKVNFDQQTSFVAKFDDTFGEDLAPDGFVANFANFNEAPTLSAPAVPPADRYAVFREIIDQELQQQQQETDLMGDLTPPPVDEAQQQEQQQQQQQQHQQQQQQQQHPQLDIDMPELEMEPPPPPAPPKIDTKITEVVAQAKDRYAALRDIILVENLFDKAPPPPLPTSTVPALAEKDLLQDLFSDEFNEDQDIRQIMDSSHDRRGLVDSRGLPAEPSSSALTIADDDDDDDEDEDEDAGGESSMDSNEKDAEPVSAQDQYEKLSTSAEKPDFKSEQEQLPPKQQDNKFLTVVSAPGRDDIEIDELMQRAISNLSLDSRDRISPATSTSRGPPPHSLHTPSQFNDVSTSPIPLQKSPAPSLHPVGASPVPSQLSAVSQLIDTATKQMQMEKPSWATFDSPKVAPVASAGSSSSHNKGKARLTLPPPPASNTSQHDTAESPCSSDPRDDAGGGWSKQQQQRRWAKKERQQTSSSSRDLSPWDDDTPEYLKQQQQRRGLPPPTQLPPHPHAPHGYYMRHARRLNSCDEDYDYDAEFCARRDREQPPRKFKHGLSRSRDNFELESPSWYHHPAHHTWSPQEMEQGVRARSFERSAYERSSYGPPAPMYDKRGQPLPRERERERSKYREREYRDYARPSYEFDYENVYEERRSPMGPSYKSRPEYLYERERDRDRDRERERERKSFDRESVESFESSTRRRRSFGSGGDVYGSLDSRDEYRERDRELKTRSLRKPATSAAAKLRVTGDIDYEQDSEQDFQQRQRSLQRPSQLGGDVVPGAAPQRLRKSSGSSPWDGEEPSLPGQKSWKRPASAAETERRLAESRRAAVLAQTPSDGEKDRRFRKKTRARSAKDLATVGGVRYGSGRGVRDNYDYISCQRNADDDDDDDDDEDYVDDEPPTDEDKFERLNRRRHEMHQRMLESERRQQERHAPALAKLSGQNRASRGIVNNNNVNSDYGFVDSYEQTPTPRSNASSTAVMMSGGESSGGPVATGGSKFNFDDGFESDFNQSSPPPAPAGTASSCNSTPAGLISASSTGGSKSLFRFSNDFSEREKLQQQLQQQQQQQQQQRDGNFEVETPPASTPPITQKLRFDDNVKVSQFDDAAFEDDFAKASFDFDKDQASPAAPSASSRKQNMRSSKLQQRQELIKKSESVNIFAKKHEDPFEDDEFFKSPDEQPMAGQGDKDGQQDANKFQWNEDSNFAKFDENM